jgi:hypothetical protein
MINDVRATGSTTQSWWVEGLPTGAEQHIFPQKTNTVPPKNQQVLGISPQKTKFSTHTLCSVLFRVDSKNRVDKVCLPLHASNAHPSARHVQIDTHYQGERIALHACGASALMVVNGNRIKDLSWEW